MRIVARLKKLDEIFKLINLGVDVFLVDTPLTVKSINKNLFDSLNDLFVYNKPVYLLVNKIIHESDLVNLNKILQIAKNKLVEGIVCNDITVMVKARESGVENKIIYQPGTMNTNSYDSEYFFTKNIKGITISKEITLEEIIKIFKNKKTEFSLVGHGFIDMFYSKRMLLTNYFIYKNITHSKIQDNYYFHLNEEKRPDNYYPILEDMGGTHIFRDKALESFNELDILKEYLDDFFVERIFLSDEEYYDSLLAYNDNTFVPDFLKKYQEHYNKGFYYQYTEKIKGELDEN